MHQYYKNYHIWTKQYQITLFFSKLKTNYNLIDLFIPFLHREEENLHLADNQHIIPLPPLPFMITWIKSEKTHPQKKKKRGFEIDFCWPCHKQVKYPYEQCTQKSSSKLFPQNPSRTTSNIIKFRTFSQPTHYTYNYYTK